MNARKLARFIATEDFVNHVDTVFDTLKNDELYNDGLNENDYANLPIGGLRELAIKRLKRLYVYGLEIPYFPFAYSLLCLDANVETRRGVQFGVRALLLF